MITGRQLTFGRGPEVDIVIPDEYVSPVHCRVIEGADGWYVQDLGSTNGTWVISRGELVKVPLGSPSRLSPGDKIRIGRTTLPWEVPQ